MTIRLSDEQLISRLTGQGDVPLFAEADGKFFPKVVQAELDFVKDADGKVTALILHQNGHDVTMDGSRMPRVSALLTRVQSRPPTRRNGSRINSPHLEVKPPSAGILRSCRPASRSTT